jgi:hypothetical protein
MANTQTTVPTFISGQVLTAAQMMNSAATGVPVFATTVTRDAGFGGAGEKVLAEGQLCYLESTNVVQYYDGAAWATLAPAPAVSSGMTLIQAETSTTAATATYSNVFSATYSLYKVFIVMTGTNTQPTLLRFTSSGTPNTATSYSYAIGGSQNGATWFEASSVSTPENKITLMQNFVNNGQIELTIQDPFQSKISRVLSAAKGYYSAGTSYALTGGGFFDASTSFDGFQLLNGNGSTFTYSTTIYGLAIS